MVTIKSVAIATKRRKMKKIDCLKKFPITKELDINGLQHVLVCLEAKEKKYKKGDIIYGFNDYIEYSGVVLSGIVRAFIFNLDGTEHNIQFYKVGDSFGEVYACLPEEKNSIQVMAHEDCTIIFLKLSNLLTDYAVKCPFASQVTSNLLKIMAEKQLFLTKKLQIVNQKKIRDKFKMFLLDSNSINNIIVLSFNRQQLADYLGVERSALSREMSKMQKDGLIKFHKNIITILDDSIFDI